MRRVVFVLSAIFFMTSAIAQAPLNEARILMGDYRSALTLAQQAAAQQNQEEAQRQMDRAMSALQQALQSFTEGEVMANGDADTIRDYAAALNAAGNPADAAEALGRATELASHDAGLWLEYGEAMSELGPNAFIDAKEAFDAAFEKASEPGMRANALAGLGALFFRHGYYPLAGGQFDAALAEVEGHPRATAGKAAIDLRNGNVKAASDALETIDAPTPAIENEATRMVADALEGFWEGRLAYEDTPENHIAYARLLIRGNYPSSAIGPLRRAIKLAPEDVGTLNTLGALMSGIGDPDSAKVYLTQSLEIKEDQPRIREFLQQINQAQAAQPAESSLPVGIAAPPPE